MEREEDGRRDPVTALSHRCANIGNAMRLKRAVVAWLDIFHDK
jgi:hypothetical protein